MYSHLKTYENAHKGEVAVLFGSGPSLNQYKRSLIPEPSVISVGVNSVIFNDSLPLDYYFTGDDPELKYGEEHPYQKKTPMTQAEKVAQRKKTENITSFCVKTMNGIGRHTPKGEAICPYSGNLVPGCYLHTDESAKKMGAIPIHCSTGAWKQDSKFFAKDITSKDMYSHSIVFPALQLLLYAGIIKIYVVGCDCGGALSYIHEGSQWNDGESVLVHWIAFKEFKEKEYPEVEMVVINSVNLKKLF